MKVLKILLIIILSPLIIVGATAAVSLVLGIIASLDTELLIKLAVAAVIILVIKKLLSTKKESNGKEWIE